MQLHDEFRGGAGAARSVGRDSGAMLLPVVPPQFAQLGVVHHQVDQATVLRAGNAHLADGAGLTVADRTLRLGNAHPPILRLAHGPGAPGIRVAVR